MAPGRALPAVLLAVLALLLPLAAIADPCPDCGAAQDCCSSPGCRTALGCACGGVLSILTATLRVDGSSSWSGLVGPPPAERRAAVDPRDVFHVPKPSLA